MNKQINPSSLASPVGFSYALRSDGGRIVWLGGHVAFDHGGFIIHTGDMVGQFRQTLANMQVTVREAGGELTDIVKMTIYTTDKRMYKTSLKDLGDVYREYFGKYFPAMTLVEVSSLFEDAALVEIDAIAVLAN
jgi:enamine deaminase RidA (YjgF/YER057c/UK114 family)